MSTIARPTCAQPDLTTEVDGRPAVVLREGTSPTPEVRPTRHGLVCLVYRRDESPQVPVAEELEALDDAQDDLWLAGEDTEPVSEMEINCVLITHPDLNRAQARSLVLWQRMQAGGA